MPNDDKKIRGLLYDISFRILVIAGIAFVGCLFFFCYKWVLISLITVIVLCLGFGIPKWWGRGERQERANRAKKLEKKDWGFHSRDRDGPWLNYIDFPLVRETEYARGKRFYSEWLIIRDGFIIVNPGPASPPKTKKTVDYDFSVKRAYAWDGCTPKKWFFWLALIGTPDWGQKIENIRTISDEFKLEDKEVFWQKAHHASLIHDALYQYLDSIPIAKKDVDRLFYEMLRESSVLWIVAKVYHFGVRRFAAKGIEEDDPKKNSKLKFKNSQGLKL